MINWKSEFTAIIFEATSKTIEEPSKILTFILTAYIRKKTLEIIVKIEVIETKNCIDKTKV